MPLPIAVVVSSKLATLAELDSVLGAQDLYSLIEIVTVDAFNHRPQD